MRKNRSPWLHQLDRDRKTIQLNGDITTDVAVVGAGIAGVSTSFFLLEYTDKKVVLVEGGKLAHGATGHNAGHVVSAFELPFAELVRRFGLENAIEGQKLVDSAWTLLDEMYQKAGLDIPFYRIVGYGGFPTFEHLLKELEDVHLKFQGGLLSEKLKVAADATYLNNIPAEFSAYYEVVNQEEINTLLETSVNKYTAIAPYHTGLLNSALFCQEIVTYLLGRYPDRFVLYEETGVGKIVLHKDQVVLDAGSYTITADKVVLCTNGFENFSIINTTGLDIDTKFHHLVNGIVGYMSAYLEEMHNPPAARYYMIPQSEQKRDFTFGEPYYYITRRPYEYEKGMTHSIVCIGGPEVSLEDRELYYREFEYSDEIHTELDSFARNTLHKDDDIVSDYAFHWHGLMGYTSTGVRLIGEEPKNKRLLYNLGCNGIGILPSIFGGKRVSQIIAQEPIPPSIFDPKGE